MNDDRWSEEIDPDTYRFDFGQYTGYTFEEILRIDPHYIQWCHQCLPQFLLREREQSRLAEKLRDE